MKRTLTFQILSIGLIFFSSCKREDSVNIDQQRIYVNYEYVYNSQNMQSTATATFRLDNSKGTKIELTYPARIDFNGEGMSYRNSSGSYQVSTSANTIGGLFKYNDLEEGVYSNTTAPLTYIELPYAITSISRNGNFFLPWEGSALQAGESISVTISGGSQTSSTSWTINTVGETYIILDQNKLNNLVQGNAEIQIKRELVTGIQQSTLAGGRMTSTYLSQKAFVNITN